MAEGKTTGLQKLCIAFLAGEWLLFGPLHFLFPGATEAQIPDLIPFKPFIAFTTGVAEVVAGICLLFGKTRRPAALVSLVLVILFVPAIWKLMADDAAMPGFLDAGVRRIVRAVLVPNHIVLALCAYFLWRSPARRRVEPGR